MRIGGSIFLAAVGAILAFAVRDSISGVDLRMIGYILMAAGIIAAIISLVVARPRSATTTVQEGNVTRTTSEASPEV